MSFHFKPETLIFQNLLIQKFQWALLIYEVSASCASSLTKRKWLNIHPPSTDIILYSPISFSFLPIKSLTVILKSSKISGHLLSDSKDPTLTSVSHSWNADSVSSIAEAELSFMKITGPY